MRAKVLNEFAGTRKYALTFEQDDEIISSLAAFAMENELQDASFSGLGTLSTVTLGWFDVSKRQYAPIPVNEPVELLMLSGQISASEEEPKISAHVVIGKSDGTAHGGHLLKATVHPKAHLFVEERLSRRARQIIPAALIRQSEACAYQGA